MEIWELIARESIRDLFARYNASGDSGRFDEMLALFCEDAVLEAQGRVYRGKAEIRGLFEGAAESTSKGQDVAPSRPRFIRHHTATHRIDLLNGDEATGRSYYQVLTDHGLDHSGRYVDRYRREGERWLFVHRKVSVDHTTPGGWGAASIDG